VAGTTVQTDMVALLVVVGLAALLALGVLLRRELAPRRPALPDDDCPPPGLSRLVPVGAQLEQECRSGLAALELWLAGRRVGP
jgi:hypothetical protein